MVGSREGKSRRNTCSFGPKNVLAVLMPELFPRNESWVLFFSSIFVSCCTLFFSGIPAALYERLAKPLADDPTSSLIWLALAFLMTIPALGTLGLI